MPLSSVHENGVAIVEGKPGETLMRKPDDAALVIEACLSARTRLALLYPANMTERFFDLSSGEAGAVLEKLRRFQIRFAVICAPGTVQFSSRFHELRADDFRVFEDRTSATEWLTASP